MSRLLTKKLVSSIDSSVNWVLPHGKSLLECRYVRRGPQYISVYLSSQNGCIMGCKFCWLTATNQTAFKHVDISQFGVQMDHVLEHAKTVDSDISQRSNVRINVNMMARGEALSNKHIIHSYPLFYSSLSEQVKRAGYREMKMNVSTIMPIVIQPYSLIDIFKPDQLKSNTNVYYSLYSTNEKFRSKWIPRAMGWRTALERLKAYQEASGNTIAIHFALIEGENDGMADVQDLCKQVRSFSFSKLKFNIVRFNPHPSLKYKETPEAKMADIFGLLKSVANETDIATNKTRIVPRAGPDTYASCGMFIDKDEYEADFD